jgi:hypothetical protein
LYYPIVYASHSLERQEDDDKFADDDIAKILLDAIETPGGAWRARGTPEALRIVEIVSIQQARDWGVCTVRLFASRLSSLSCLIDYLPFLMK